MSERKTIVYLSGPINNNMNGYRAEFAKAEQIALQRNRIVLNPATLPVGLSEQSYMRIGLSMVEAADEIVLLDGWARSEGATVEWAYAKRIGKRILPLAELEKEQEASADGCK